jgi:hypothetical protein
LGSGRAARALEIGGRAGGESKGGQAGKPKGQNCNESDGGGEGQKEAHGGEQESHDKGRAGHEEGDVAFVKVKDIGEGS